MLRSARNRMRGRRVGSRPRFQEAWKSFQAIWKAIEVLPVPVARVRRMRSRPRAVASRTAVMALCW
jgi:hypothetical protein